MQGLKTCIMSVFPFMKLKNVRNCEYKGKVWQHTFTFYDKDGESMLKYEIVSILRNKAAYIFCWLFCFFGLKATVELQRSITSSQDTNYIKRELQYELGCIGSC